MTRRVLIADDSELDLQLTCRALKKLLPEWQIDSAETGNLASEKIGTPEGIELVLLDFKMPGSGALEILAKTEPTLLGKVPFILFSSSVSPTDVSKCEAFGVREYVEKPTDPSVYAEALARICRKWISSDSPTH